ncbi:trichohyalin [Aethina tumida]|uniref:trichohyalin n=1 Tax=Aethina tumida TaxID=116153 RepID=UPI002148769C|nr:trichohyalin [Aethina tumida]
MKQFKKVCCTAFILMVFYLANTDGFLQRTTQDSGKEDSNGFRFKHQLRTQSDVTNQRNVDAQRLFFEGTLRQSDNRRNFDVRSNRNLQERDSRDNSRATHTIRSSRDSIRTSEKYAQTNERDHLMKNSRENVDRIREHQDGRQSRISREISDETRNVDRRVEESRASEIRISSNTQRRESKQFREYQQRENIRDETRDSRVSRLRESRNQDQPQRRESEERESRLEENLRINEDIRTSPTMRSFRGQFTEDILSNRRIVQLSKQGKTRNFRQIREEDQVQYTDTIDENRDKVRDSRIFRLRESRNQQQREEFRERESKAREINSRHDDETRISLRRRSTKEILRNRRDVQILNEKLIRNSRQSRDDIGLSRERQQRDQARDSTISQLRQFWNQEQRRREESRKIESRLRENNLRNREETSEDRRHIQLSREEEETRNFRQSRDEGQRREYNRDQIRDLRTSQLREIRDQDLRQSQEPTAEESRHQANNLKEREEIIRDRQERSREGETRNTRQNRDVERQREDIRIFRLRYERTLRDIRLARMQRAQLRERESRLRENNREDTRTSLLMRSFNRQSSVESLREHRNAVLSREEENRNSRQNRDLEQRRREGSEATGFGEQRQRSESIERESRLREDNLRSPKETRVSLRRRSSEETLRDARASREQRKEMGERTSRLRENNLRSHEEIRASFLMHTLKRQSPEESVRDRRSVRYSRVERENARQNRDHEDSRAYPFRKQLKREKSGDLEVRTSLLMSTLARKSSEESSQDRRYVRRFREEETGNFRQNRDVVQRQRGETLTSENVQRERDETNRHREQERNEDSKLYARRDQVDDTRLTRTQRSSERSNEMRDSNERNIEQRLDAKRFRRNVPETIRMFEARQKSERDNIDLYSDATRKIRDDFEILSEKDYRTQQNESSYLLNTVKVLLVTLLVAQMFASSSKTKNWANVMSFQRKLKVC